VSSPAPFTLDERDGGATLAAALRRRLPGWSWGRVRTLCETGKVRVDTQVVTDPSRRLAAGAGVVIDMTARLPRPERAGFRIAFEDAHIVVIEKPAGVSSVPYERKESGTALDLIREAWRYAGKRATATPLYTVHRIDKETSGLLCFAKTRFAERALHRVFQQHLAAREYLAVAHGDVASHRIESVLVPDRGDGLRGSTRRRGEGQHAVTHVRVAQKLRGATLLRVTLETGRTHQIRVHLAEEGHPLVGEAVYIRDFLRAGGHPLPAPRLMLHAATLGVPHPVTGQRIDLRAPAPPDLVAVVRALGGEGSDVVDL
jgi:23S rRNA pseudouridine1911/1915/1917 synthase